MKIKIKVYLQIEQVVLSKTIDSNTLNGRNHVICLNMYMTNKEGEWSIDVNRLQNKKKNRKNNLSKILQIKNRTEQKQAKNDTNY